ncbi:hypothetical protein Tco_0262204 [Tanacetum coccineum]
MSSSSSSSYRRYNQDEYWRLWFGNVADIGLHKNYGASIIVDPVPSEILVVFCFYVYLFESQFVARILHAVFTYFSVDQYGQRQRQSTSTAGIMLIRITGTTWVHDESMNEGSEAMGSKRIEKSPTIPGAVLGLCNTLTWVEICEKKLRKCSYEALEVVVQVRGS